MKYITVTLKGFSFYIPALWILEKTFVNLFWHVSMNFWVTYGNRSLTVSYSNEYSIVVSAPVALRKTANQTNKVFGIIRCHMVDSVSSRITNLVSNEKYLMLVNPEIRSSTSLQCTEQGWLPSDTFDLAMHSSKL